MEQAGDRMPDRKMTPDGKFQTVGKSVPRVDAFEKVTGRAKYADDLSMPNMLHAVCVHSKAPHASVKVNAEKALSMPGVALVLTEKDFPKPQSMLDFWYCTDHPKFCGDVVAVVAAETRTQAENAAAEVKVISEKLPGVYTVQEALAPDSPVIREKGVGLRNGMPDPSEKGNVFLESYHPLRKGDVAEGFARSDVILERTYATGFVEHAYIEPESALTYYDDVNQLLTIRSCSQQGHMPREFVADALRLPMNRVRAVQCTVGGSFGGKFEMTGLMCARAALVTQKTGRPCKITYTREDSILESAKRHPFYTTIRIGADRNGKILAYQARQLENCGAYNNQAPWMNIRAMVHSAGPYEIENVWTDTFGVFTNTLSPCAFRGYSSPQVIFGNEMIMDELAGELGISVLDLKRKNLLRKGSRTATGQELIHETILADMMESVAAETDYERKKREYRNQTGRWRKGISLVTSYRGSALGGEGVDSSGAMFTALPDGSFILNAALMEVGQGLRTVYAQIVSEASGIALDDIMVEAVDTHHIPDSGLTVASRGTAQGGQSVKMAGEKMKEMLLESAAELLHAKPEELILENSICCVAKEPERRITMAEICTYRKYAGLPLATYQWYIPRPLVNDEKTGQGEAFTTYAYGVTVAEVLVNTGTGEVKIERVTAAHDVGKAINPGLIKGQIYGGIMMGIGFGLWEEVRVPGGKTEDTNLDAYHIATARDVPDIRIRIFESRDPEGTYGAKCIAEAATEMTGTAVALAVQHAIGKTVRQLPLTMERIVCALDDDAGEETAAGLPPLPDVR